MHFEDWGLIDYAEALEKQLQYVEEVASGAREDTIVFCSHPPVVTKGRLTQVDDITTWTGPQFEISRGGRATYHGPSQLVVYPIVHLQDHNVVGLLRKMEQAIIAALKEYGVEARGKSIEFSPKHEGDKLEDTGVWVGEKKIASLGIAVKKWVSYHGAAINIYRDEKAFQGINPCGYSPSVMTSLQECLPPAPSSAIGATDLRQEISQKVRRSFSVII